MLYVTVMLYAVVRLFDAMLVHVTGFSVLCDVIRHVSVVLLYVIFLSYHIVLYYAALCSAILILGYIFSVSHAITVLYMSTFLCFHAFVQSNASIQYD